MPDVETHRIFIALPVSECVKAALERTQSELRSLLPAGRLRWTPPEQFHITLKFLGNVEINRLTELCEAARSACAKFSPLELSAEGIGAFPNLRAPRVFWGGVRDDTAQLLKLQAAIERAVIPFTALKPEKTFSGHITLARAKEGKGLHPEIIAGRIHGLRTMSVGSWTASEIKVMRSKLSKSGATHEDVAALPLSAKFGG